MKAVAIVLAGMTALAADVGWEFANATHAPDKAEGRADGGALEISMPSKRSCAWWEKEFPVAPGRGARLRAT